MSSEPANGGAWVIVCRCEELYRVEIVEAIRAGARTPDEIKRLTRCGMGPCQWKGCWLAVAAILSEETGAAPADLPPPNLRAPARPVRLSALLMERHEEGKILGPPLE